jgi:hypothetical protein
MVPQDIMNEIDKISKLFFTHPGNHEIYLFQLFREREQDMLCHVLQFEK